MRCWNLKFLLKCVWAQWNYSCLKTGKNLLVCSLCRKRKTLTYPYINIHMYTYSPTLNNVCFDFYKRSAGIWAFEMCVPSLWVIPWPGNCSCPAHWATAAERQGAVVQTKDRGYYHWYCVFFSITRTSLICKKKWQDSFSNNKGNAL